MCYHLGLGVISETKTVAVKGMVFSTKDTPFETWDTVLVGYDIYDGEFHYYASKHPKGACVSIFPI
jgi:hypothetical protein